MNEEKINSVQASSETIGSRTIPIYWLAGLLPLLCLIGAWTNPALAIPIALKTMTAQVYLSGLLVYWCWHNRSSSYLRIHFTSIRVLITTLFALGTISVTWSVNTDFFVNKWLMWSTGAIMFFFAVRLEHNLKNLHIIFNSIFFAGVITSLIGVAQFLFLWEALPQVSFPASTFGNGNIAGHIVVLCFPAGAYLFFKQNSYKSIDWIYSIGIALLLAYGFYTRSRGIWISLGSELCLLAAFILFDRQQRHSWLFWDRNKTRACLAAILLLAVLLNVDSGGFNSFSELSKEELLSLASSLSDGGSGRYSLWIAALDMIKENPVAGTGLGSFLENFNQGYYTISNWNLRRAHNDLLEFGIELGLLGYLILISIAVLMLPKLRDLLKESRGTKRLAYVIACIAISGSALNAQVSFPYQLQVPLIFILLYLGLIIKAEEEINPNMSRIKEFVLSSRSKYAALACSVLLFLFVVVINLQWWKTYNELSSRLENPSLQTEFKTNKIFVHQDLIPILRSLSFDLDKQGEHERALALTPFLLNYWPRDAFNISLQANHYIGLGKYDDAERLISTSNNQPIGSYFMEHLLIRIYLDQARTTDLRDLYNRLALEPEELLKLRYVNYGALHFLSIHLKDYQKTRLFYDTYLRYFSTRHELESNMVSYYMNTGQEEKAVPHMVKALSIKPDVRNADEMRRIIKKYSS